MKTLRDVYNGRLGPFRINIRVNTDNWLVAKVSAMDDALRIEFQYASQLQSPSVIMRGICALAEGKMCHADNLTSWRFYRDFLDCCRCAEVGPGFQPPMDWEVPG